MMRALLIADGVPDSAIALEDQSTTTLENIRNAAAMLTAPEVIIVTDAYHAPRALLTARHFGLRAKADCPARPGPQWRYHLREALALPIYALRLWLRGSQG